VASLKRNGRYADGGGLYLKIDGNRRRWLYRYIFHGKHREIGLGGAEVSLADARRTRNKWRDILDSGRDPIEDRNKAERGVARPSARLPRRLLPPNNPDGDLGSTARSGV
jgi:hypothetical protein